MGANVNLQDIYGNTALRYASIYLERKSTERTIEMLINSGFNVNLQDNVSRTALHCIFTYTKQVLKL